MTPICPLIFAHARDGERVNCMGSVCAWWEPVERSSPPKPWGRCGQTQGRGQTYPDPAKETR